MKGPDSLVTLVEMQRIGIAGMAFVASIFGQSNAALKMTEIQIIGSHNSYHAGLAPSEMAHLRKVKAITAIGLGFAVQEVETIPALSHDMKLNYVLTELKAFDFRSS